MSCNKSSRMRSRGEGLIQTYIKRVEFTATCRHKCTNDGKNKNVTAHRLSGLPVSCFLGNGENFQYFA